MKKIFIVLLSIAVCGCNQKRNSEIEGDHASYDEKEMIDGEEWSDDRANEFVEEAAMVDKFQIRVGKLAQQKAENGSVGIYGKMILDDHTLSLQKLKKIAQQRNVTISDSLDNEHQRKLMELEGIEGQAFDRRFLEMMIKGHKKDIEKWENALTSMSTDNPVKDWVDDTLTNLRRHLQKGQQLQNQANMNGDNSSGGLKDEADQ